jgi:hypothetical protein
MFMKPAFLTRVVGTCTMYRIDILPKLNPAFQLEIPTQIMLLMDLTIYLSDATMSVHSAVLSVIQMTIPRNKNQEDEPSPCWL